MLHALGASPANQPGQTWLVIDHGAGSAYVEGNTLTLEPAPANDAAQARSATALLASAELSDYAYSLRLTSRPLPDNAAPPRVSLLIRYGPSGSGYYVAHSAAGLELGKLNGARQQILTRLASPIAGAQDAHEYRVEAAGSTIRVAIDGQLWISYDDPQPILSGGAGISIQGVHAVITDAHLDGVSADWTPTLAQVSLSRVDLAGATGALPRSAVTATPAPSASVPEATPVAIATPVTEAAMGGLVGWDGGPDGPAGSPRLLPAPIVGPPGTTALAAGLFHSLALDASGRVWAWGSNGGGQLGDGTTQDRQRPEPVRDLDAVTSIAAGDEHSLALRSDGTVWAWGANASGQLGDGTTDDRTHPVRVEALDDVRSIAAGHAFSLALKADGSVWAWGANEAGQLGDGTNISSVPPVRVRELDGVEAIAAGAYFSLARKSDGSVWAWGANEYGQVGQGAPSDGRNAPVPVAGLTAVTSIAAGGYHALALDASGAAWAWGANWFGELGTPTTEPCEHGGKAQRCSSTPRQVQGISVPLVRLAGGEFHSLGLGSDGSVWAWGLNADGEVGVGGQQPGAPVRVGGLAGELTIAAGGLHSLAAGPAGSTHGRPP